MPMNSLAPREQGAAIWGVGVGRCCGREWTPPESREQPSGGKVFAVVKARNRSPPKSREQPSGVWVFT
eukprot:11752448-Karenia_brevis.AAC.1